MSNDIELQEALKITGAQKCEFEPDEDPCETCGESFKQHYYIRECFDSDEGSYHCAECIKKMPAKWAEEGEQYMKHAVEMGWIEGAN